jgi:cystathionine beta-lyase/cystathionine gamma-synthase
MEFSTTAIHHGQSTDAATGAVSAPIYQTSTFEQDAPGRNRGYDYARTNNPTRARVEGVLAALEHGHHAALFGSGLAAEHAILQAYLRPGDGVVVPLDVYGGTYRLLHRVFEPLGCTVTPVDFSDLAAVGAAVTAGPRLVWLESPTRGCRSTTSARCAARRTTPGRSWSSTTRLRRPTSSGRSTSAPTWSCTASPSTSPATPT